MIHGNYNQGTQIDELGFHKWEPLIQGHRVYPNSNDRICIFTQKGATRLIIGFGIWNERTHTQHIHDMQIFENEEDLMSYLEKFI